MMIRTTISWKQLFKGIWKYVLCGLVMYVIVNRICQTINMTIANLCLQVIIGISIYIIGLLITKASIVGKAKEILSKR